MHRPSIGGSTGPPPARSARGDGSLSQPAEASWDSRSGSEPARRARAHGTNPCAAAWRRASNVPNRLV